MLHDVLGPFPDLLAVPLGITATGPTCMRPDCQALYPEL